MALILQFKPKYVPVVASCDTCFATRCVYVREIDYGRYLKGDKKICPDCGHPTLHYCTKDCH